MGKINLNTEDYQKLKYLHVAAEKSIESFVRYFYDMGFKVPEYRSGNLTPSEIRENSDNNIIPERFIKGGHTIFLPEEVPDGWTVRITFYIGKTVMGPYACPVASTQAERDVIARSHGIESYDQCICEHEDGSSIRFKKVNDVYIDNEGERWRVRNFTGKKKKKE